MGGGLCGGGAWGVLGFQAQGEMDRGLDGPELPRTQLDNPLLKLLLGHGVHDVKI